MTNDLIATLEALMIGVTDPPLNRRRETITGATLVRQIEPPASPTVDERLDEIHAELARLSGHIGQIVVA